MAKKTLFYIILATLLLMVETANAQVKIYGNVYGGGEKAQVIEPNLDSLKNHVIQDADLKTLFTKEHTYTTYVRLGENTEVYGRTFGGGMGHEDTQGESAGRVTGQTDVVLDGATVWSELFGGGENADVRGNTLLHFKKGKAGHNAFGGGLGLLGKMSVGNKVPLELGDKLPDNQCVPLASADIKLVPANYDLIVNDNADNLAILRGYYNQDGTTDVKSSNWIQDKITGESFVVFDGTEESYTHYEFKEARTIHRDNSGNVTKNSNGYYYDTENQYNPENPSQLFSINHNIYGGGMTASKIEGKTFVYINYGMVDEEMMSWTGNGKEAGSEPVWSKVYNSIANAQFCVFGGGYGYHSQVNGDTHVTMDIMGSGQYKYITEFTQWFANEGKTKYHWDTNTGTPENIYKAADESTWSHGAPGRSAMDIIGGGYNGKVLGTTHITIGGDVIVRKVYGGGYYASVGNTDVNIKSGIFNRVYGGGLIGNVYGKATLNVGQKGNTDVIINHNTHLMVKDAIYGGNDVSGTVGTSAATEVTHQATNVKYNVYSPVDDDNHGVRLNIYGGLVLGDVYGAGNGNHPGYGNPDYMEFNLSQHPSENYRQLAHQGTKGTGLVYKYRPRTGRVVMNLQGNSGTDFNDEPLVDKVRIWGRTFGGGNSCNVGIWDGTADDNTEVYAETGSWHPGDNFQGQGTIAVNIGSHVQLGNRNDSHETPNGLFMGCNGEHMVTQHLDKEKAKYYHQYWDSKAKCYYPGFVVYKDDAKTPIKRTTGLKAFTAFINNILTKSDNVTLNVKNLDNTDATDVWMSNFVGGGYRGSMQAATEKGRFAYALPKGVTVGHAVVGGAFNAHIIYRVYKTDYSTGEYYVDPTTGNYAYETIEPTGEGSVISKEQAEKEGKTEYDYIKKLYDENGNLEGYLRYNFDGGMMGHLSGPIAKDNGVRCGNVRAGDAEDFTRVNGGSESIFDKTKALVYLDLRNRMEPIVETTKVDGQDKKTVHGGIVYGGCFYTGYVDGDSWVDYRCSLSPLCTDADFFDKTKADLYEKVDNIEDYNAMNVYGAGYGTDSHVMGDAYLRILHNGSSDNTNDYPFIYNAFGGGNNGTVAGNTNVYFNVGSKGTVLGSLYAGGYKGEIGGNTKLELAGGLLINAYGGSREANIKGATHVWAYDGQLRDGEDETSPEHAPLLIGNLYGGNDISGTISGTKPAKWTKTPWNETATSDKQWTDDTKFTTCVQIGGTEHSTRGYPMIGNVFAGGNGIDTPEGTAAPDVASSLLEVSGGTVLRAFGGGNKATITGETCIFTQATDNTFATFNFTDYHKTVLNNTVLNNIHSGYNWEGTTLKLDPHHVVKLYGGNNLAPMAIQPTWNLAAGSLEYVYSGGNLGDMTHPNGIHIDVTSDKIKIKNLFGGCRMADVKPTAIAGQESEFNTYWNDDTHYGSTVNCTGGYITNVYGGNDISGTVAHGTKVIIDGAVDNDVYCAGNGNYLYKWDKDVAQITEVKEGDDVIYKVPAMTMFGGKDANDTQKLLTINAYRPSVDRSSLEIAGDSINPSDIKVAFVKGNVYCGGNASTVTGKSSTDLTIGSHVNIHGLFMGSDGYDYSQQEYIAKFEKLNGFDMTEPTNFTGLNYGESEGQVPSTLMTAAEEIYYPTLVALYMKSVEMESLPNIHIDKEHVTNAYIGTWCGGGNRGSMTTQEKVTVEIPSNITIYDKVVAGCMDARMKYVGKSTIEDVGGYYRPLTWNGEGEQPTTKLDYTINAKFLPRYMSVPKGMAETEKNPENENFMTARAHYFLYENAQNKQYGVGNNIYGGCYEAGDILGDVVLNVNSDLLEEPLKVEEGTQPNREKLNNTSRNEVAAFNVYGAGMGMTSNVWGNVTINMNGNANNVYGGGRSGMLIGNATINMLNGIVYRHIIGGSDAGYVYGNTQIAVGEPKRYKCNTKGVYTLTRADQWNDDKTNHDGTNPIVKTINLLQGDIISESLYEMLTDKSNFTEMPALVSGWTDRNIYIGGGIYGGGYALATGSTVYAGDITVKKYDDLHCPVNPNTGEMLTNVAGYGGNSTIMVADDPANATSGTTDHITISTLVPVQKTGMSSKLGFFTRSGDGSIKNALGDPVYTWTTQADGAPVDGTAYYELSAQGGIFGDGHLSFVEGFRSADIQLYGYAGSTPQHPKLLNTFQRLDVASVKDCCIMLQGARDFATNETDATVYSVSRVRELQMKSTLGDADLDKGNSSGDNDNVDRIHNTVRSRNYIGFYNNVHYLGAVKSDVAFGSDRFGEDGVKTGTSYLEYKATIVSSCYGKEGTELYNQFRTRNLGTAKNMIGINNGYTLKIQNVKTVSEGSGSAAKDEMFYGPVVGVFEAKLLSLVPGEGGGYIYADNVHNSASNFLNTSGNFVFPSTVTVAAKDANSNSTQYIVDDCFPAKFNSSTNAEAHYWYVEGNKYWYNASITGYTANNANMIFNMDNADQIVTLFGTEKTTPMVVKSITWQHAHSDGYDCDIANTTDPNKRYDFSLSVSNSGTYNTTGGYLASMPRSDVKTLVELTYANGHDNCQGNPLLGIQLIDNVENNAAEYYDEHLKEPCSAKIVLTSGNGENYYEYTINLDVIYLKGPSVTGTVMIDNCALPGELIRATVKNLDIQTNDGMPVTRTYWRVVDPTDGTKTEEIARVNTTEIDPSKVDFKALYKYNGWKLQYVVEALGNNFPVDVSANFGNQIYDSSKDGKFKTLLVHNYHKMADVQARQSTDALKLDPQAGARVYINSEEDLKAFGQWVNAGNVTEGIDFYLQNDLALPADWNISNTFAGTLHGDGYVLDASEVTGTETLFGAQYDKAKAKVYNLGVVGATITTVADSSASVINCFDSNTAEAGLRYGKKAYALSHYFKQTDGDGGYVQQYYSGDDWRYAHTTDSNDGVHTYLRTGAPAYGAMNPDGTVKTSHDDTHNVTGYTPVAVDYLFFGQHLNKDNADAHPVHLNTGGGNRVYETAGYYQSKNDDKFYFNKDAWAIQPTLTAIDFTNATREADGEVTLNSFNKHEDVTQNLLIYNADKDVFTKKETTSTIPEENVVYHNIIKSTSGELSTEFSTEYLHLVDKQDFNAPIAFTVINRIWYERKPQNYRNLVLDNYQSGSAWEGICLPFTATKVTAEKNGEISHFYGGDGIHHEYWLRGLKSISGDNATFVRPAVSGEGYFVDDTNQKGVSYTYPKNDYFTYLYGYNGHFDTRDDEGDDTMGTHDKAWYSQSHTFADYVPLAAGIPYIVAFPGDDFYEFSMESYYEINKYDTVHYCQKATFEASRVVIGVSDDNMHDTMVGGISHKGTFLHVDSRSGKGINAEGTAFEADQSILPFRTYMTTSAKTRSIFISDGNWYEDEDDEPEEPADELGEDYLKIWGEGLDVVIETSEARSFNLYGLGGAHMGILRCEPGVNRFPQKVGGIYLVGRAKVLLR